MRRIMLLNPKGGCGKSTLSTNLAACLAAQGRRVALADFDRQGSARAWLRVRPEERVAVGQVEVEEGKMLVPWHLEYLIMDSPAALHDKALKKQVKQAQTLIIPVLPSPIDIQAAADFIAELLTVGRVSREATRVAVVANRVREQTLAYRRLARFLERLEIPFVATFRDTQNYVHAAERGLGICELPPSQAASDLAQWRRLLKWLDSSESLPRKKPSKG